MENDERVETGQRAKCASSSTLTRHGLIEDATLCEMAQAGDRRALQELLRRHDKWIRRCAGRWRIPGHDDEDVYSVALTGAMKAITQFDSSRRVKFVTFLWYCIRTECEHAYVYEARLTRGHGAVVLSLDDDHALIDGISAGAGRSVEEMAIGQVEAERLRRVLISSQQGRSARRNCAVIEHLIAGDGLRDVGATMGLSAQFVHRIRERARVPLEKARVR